MPFGLMFISIEFTWYQIAVILVAGPLMVLGNLAAVVLPVLALVALLGRRWRRAAILGAIGLPLMALCFWPMLRDGWQFRQAIGQAEAVQVTRSVPDLTGKVVAFLADDTQSTDVIFSCSELMNHSGATKIYLLGRKSTWSYDRLDPDWSGEVDLTHWILGEAVPARPDWDSSDGVPRCALGPTNSGIERIDYFIARDTDLRDENAPQGFVSPRLLHDFGARLEEFFAPVADAHAFRIAPGTADLVRIPIASEGSGLPWPIALMYRDWPSNEQELRDFHAPVQAALCRHAGTECGRF